MPVESFNRYSWRATKRVPALAFQAGDGVAKTLGLVVLLVAIFNREAAQQVGSWDGISPLWALVPFVFLFVRLLLKANYEEFARLAEAQAAGNLANELQEVADRITALMNAFDARKGVGGSIRALVTSGPDRINQNNRAIEDAKGRYHEEVVGDALAAYDRATEQGLTDGSQRAEIAGAAAIDAIRAIGVMFQSLAERERRKDQPQLSFGRAVIPPDSQMIRVPDPYGFPANGAQERMGRIIRVPVTNAQGAAQARQVHARLTFKTGSGTSGDQFVPAPTQGEWFGEHGPEIEIDLPGNGRPRLIDVALVEETDYPNVYEWTAHSKAAGLYGYVAKCNPVLVEIDVKGSGSGAFPPTIKRTLEIDCREGKIRADWTDKGEDEATNRVAYTATRTTRL